MKASRSWSAEGVRGGDAGEESGDVATGFDSVASLAE